MPNKDKHATADTVQAASFIGRLTRKRMTRAKPLWFHSLAIFVGANFGPAAAGPAGPAATALCIDIMSGVHIVMLYDTNR